MTALESEEPAAGDVLWSPPDDIREHSRIGSYLSWLREERGLAVDGYEDLRRWSVSDLDGFWSSVWEHFGIRSSTPWRKVLANSEMPGAEWFEGTSLNYAEHALEGPDAGGGDALAVLARSQTRGAVELSWAELRDQVARARVGLMALGVGRGDRVAAYLPNIPETLVAFLATASLGAVWASCAPEMGVRAVVDRVGQLDPKVLLAVDGYRYGEREIDRRGEVAQLVAALPTLEATVVVPYLLSSNDAVAGIGAQASSWDGLLADTGPLVFEPLPFDHPLYVLFSSGTTGLPKAIIHCHGGILLEHLKVLALHQDLGAGDRFFWFTTTAWMMWNYLVSGLLVGSAVVLFDGDPAFPDLSATWQMASELQVTSFGTSAGFLLACRKGGLRPGAQHDLSALRWIGSTGAPLPSQGFRWVYEAVAPDVMMASMSGGTDVCSGFVGGVPLLPVVAGRISCRMLGASVEAFDDDGRSVIDRQGELVITRPMPSMPVGFWGDEDGSRYRAAYFEAFPRVWTHGDWITIHSDGSCVITGRSDTTLNRGGVRLGTSEIYTVVEALPEVADSLVVHREDDEGGPGRLLLFVRLAGAESAQEDADVAELRASVAQALRNELSPRHVPDELFVVPDVPRTLSGKKLELPVKKILTGKPAAEVASPGSLANPDSLAAFEALARRGL